VGLRFVESKFSPSMSILLDVGQRQTFTGGKVTLAGEAKQHLVPLSTSDAVQAYNSTHSLLVGLGAFGLAGTGVGVQTYGAKKPKTKKKAHSRGSSKNLWGSTQPAKHRKKTGTSKSSGNLWAR
jgi:hypothetical protein